jgi:hypothetical protein
MYKYRKIIYGFMILVLLFAGVASVIAYSLQDPTTKWNVTPVDVDYVAQNIPCPEGSTLVKDAFDGSMQGDTAQIISESYTIDGHTVTVKITEEADNSFRFDVDGGFMAIMYVKGAQYFLKYQYDPPLGFPATNTGPVTYETGLHDGYVDGNNNYQNVSHLDMCLIPKEYLPLTAEKTAVGTYDRTVTWTLDKSVDDDSHTGYAGQVAGTSNWKVVADKTEVSDNYQVTGSITINNPNVYPVDFTVSDQLNDLTVAAVDCDLLTEGDQAFGTIPVKDSIICSYSASPTDGTATLNTAEIDAMVDDHDLGTTATAEVSFTEHLFGYDSGTLSDNNPYNPYPSTTISGDTTWTYGQTFTCPSDPTVYGTDGTYSFNVPNTATLNDNIDLSDTENVDVTCYLQPLVPTKTAAGTYDREVTWTLDKSVDDDSHTGFAGQTAGTSNWTVVANKTELESNFKVTGEITIENPAAIPQAFTVSDSLSDFTVATVDCDPLTSGDQAFGTVPAASGGVNGKVVCTYEAKPSGRTAELNTATVSAVGNPDQTATAEVSFTENLIGYDSGTLSDDNKYNPNDSTVIYGDTTWTYDETFTCSSNPADYTNGAYSFNVPNTATLNDNINLSDTENVDVTCFAPVITKDATATYDERHIWDVDKTVDPTLQGGLAGVVLDWTWTVTVSETLEEENFLVTGDINVANPAGSPGDMTVSLVDQLNDGKLASVDCGAGATSITVAPGATGTCAYTAEPGGRTATLNTATGTFNSIDLVATAPVSFVKTIVKGTATVRDTEIGLDEPLTAGKGPWTFTGNDDHTCSTDRADYFVDGVYKQGEWSITNWAYVYSGGIEQDKEDATTTYTCDASFVDVLKTTNSVVDPTKDIRFKLYDGAGTDLMDEVSTFGDADGQLQFQTALVPGDTYTICEAPVSAGYTFEITVDGGNVLTYAGPPGEEFPTGEFQCFDFTAPAEMTTVVYNVNNRYPGGAPRTPGYWKNWSTCSGGNQQYTAEALGGVAEGVYLLDDLLPQTIGSFTIDDINIYDKKGEVVDTYSACEVGVSILSAKDYYSGKNKANDAGYTLARALLAARLNQDAGACVTDKTWAYGDGDPMTFEQVLTAADALLSKHDYAGTGDVLSNKDKQVKEDYAYALWLYEIIDDYNNGVLCSGEPSH